MNPTFDLSSTAPRRSAWRSSLLDALALILVLALMIGGFSLASEHFFSPLTLKSIANASPELICVAVGMTLVLLIGGIDLSVGSVLALSSAVLGVSILRMGAPLWLAIVLSLFTGLLAGTLNGLVTIAWKVPSFIVTLGMLEIARGLTYLATGSQTQYIGQPIEKIAEVSLAGLSLPFLLALLLVLLAQMMLSLTVFGRYLRALGNNETAVRLSGIRTAPVKVVVFALSGLFAGIGAVMQTSRIGSADPNAGSGLELTAIAAAVIGGTSLMGGRGSALKSFLGVMVIAVLGSGLAQVGASEPAKRVITGGLIVAAVVVDYYRRRGK